MLPLPLLPRRAALKGGLLPLMALLMRQGVVPAKGTATYAVEQLSDLLFFACARLGIGMSPLSWRAAPRELAYELGVVDPQLVVVEEEW